MRIASTIGATSLAHDGVTYEPDEAGLFEVPQHVGEALTGFPHWVPESAAVDEQLAREASDRLDPALNEERIARLEQDRADLLDMLEELTGRVEELEKRPTATEELTKQARTTKPR